MISFRVTTSLFMITCTLYTPFGNLDNPVTGIILLPFIELLFLYKHLPAGIIIYDKGGRYFLIRVKTYRLHNQLPGLDEYSYSF
jgi:hypothetical protein